MTGVGGVATLEIGEMLGIDKEGLDARRGVPWVRLNFMPG